jgi:phage baseplate assembly protein W
MATTDKDFIGSGLIFPLNIDDKGGVRPETGKALIDSSIRSILATPSGVKYFSGIFHSRISELLEEPNDSVVLALLGTFINESLSKWETRIEIEDINYSQGTKSIIVSITYKVLATKEEGTFVFPFYTKLTY